MQARPVGLRESDWTAALDVPAPPRQRQMSVMRGADRVRAAHPRAEVTVVDWTEHGFLSVAADLSVRCGFDRSFDFAPELVALRAAPLFAGERECQRLDENPRCARGDGETPVFGIATQ